MVMQTIYTSQTPTGNFDDGTSLTIATSFYSDVDGWIYGHRFYGHTSPSGVYTGQLWQVTSSDDTTPGGTKLVQKAHSSVVSGWNELLYDTPIPITANVPYRTAVHAASGLYVAISGQFASSGVDNGNLHAYRNGETAPVIGVIRNGNFFEPNATVNDYPGSFFGGSGYMVDVLFSTEDPDGNAATQFMCFF